MDDLDELLNATMAALDSFGFTRAAETLERASTEIDRLRAKVEALRADAERYRWLREQHWNDSPMCVVMNPRACVKLGSDCPSDERLDAAVDAARAAQGDKT